MCRCWRVCRVLKGVQGVGGCIECWGVCRVLEGV